MSGGDGRAGLSGAGTAAGAARGAGSLRAGVPGAATARVCGTDPPGKERRGRTRLPSAVSAAGTARRAGQSAGRRWAEPAPPRRQSRCSSAAERGARWGDGGKRRRRVAVATGGAAAARTEADPVCSGAGSGARAAGAPAPSGMAPRHVPVAPCPLCSEQQLPSPARCLGRMRCHGVGE